MDGKSRQKIGTVTQKEILTADARARREEDIHLHGRPTVFRSRKEENPKAYRRHPKHRGRSL